jgi:hypothetical protein
MIFQTQFRYEAKVIKSVDPSPMDILELVTVWLDILFFLRLWFVASKGSRFEVRANSAA